MRRNYLFFAVATAGLLMVSVDATILAVGLGIMEADLQTNLVLIGWAVTGYQLTNTIMLPIWGQVSDTWGHRKIFLASLTLFTVGSLLCGLAPNIESLIAARVLQAFGGGGILPAATAIVAHQFAENRARMVGLFASVFPIGGIVGPALGGWLLEHFGWRSLFFINVPIGAAAVLGGWFLVQRQPGSHKRPRLDLPGSFLFAGGMVAILVSLTQVGNDVGVVRSAGFWATLIGGAWLLVLFVWHELRVDQPIVDLRLFRDRAFVMVNLYQFVFGIAIFGVPTFLPYHVQVNYQASPADSGLALVPRGLFTIVFSMVSSVYIIQYTYRIPLLSGMLLMSLSIGLLALNLHGLQVGTQMISDLWLPAAIIGLSGIGLGIANPAARNAALELLPDRTAAVTGIRSMFAYTGGIISVAAIAVFLSQLADKGRGLLFVLGALTGIMLLTLPICLFIPDGPFATWRESRRRSHRAIGAASSSDESAPVTAPSLPGQQ